MASDSISSRPVSAVLLSDDAATREAFEAAVDALAENVSGAVVATAEDALEGLPAAEPEERFSEVPLAVLDAVALADAAVEVLEAVKGEGGRRRTPTIVLDDPGTNGGRDLYLRNANAVVPWPPDGERQPVLADVLEFWLTVPALP